MPLTTVIVGPRCRLSVVPPARASNAATSRSAPLRLLTNSRPPTSTGRCVSPGAAALAVTRTRLGGSAADGPSLLVPPLLDFGICGSGWLSLTTLGLAESSAGASRTTAGGSGAPPAGGGVEGADCAGRAATSRGSAGVFACILATSSAYG